MPSPKWKPRKPDWKVKVAIPTPNHPTKDYRYYEVGAGWSNENGGISFNVCTMPDVRFRLFPADDEQGEKET